MTAVDQDELDLQADYGWFHIMRPRLVKGLIGEIGETAWAVYTIIKAHANHHTGKASPSQERIGKMIGKTSETVGKATKVLEEHGLLKREKVGRHTEYSILESAPVYERGVKKVVQGSADFDYVPKEFANQLAALKAFVQDGIPPGRGITLNLTINLVQQGDNGVVNMQNIQISPQDAQRADFQEFVQKMRRLG
jgi:DNA-binding Lrp family transcriptional regulator